MISLIIHSNTRYVWSNLFNASSLLTRNSELSFHRSYAKKSDDGCRRAIVDIPPDEDPACPGRSVTKKKKEGLLRKITLKVIEGGTNFGTPFRRLECKKEEKKEKKPKEETEPVALPAPKTKVLVVPPARPGVQVSILGADTAIGQYVALLLKQCPCIKKLRLYESKDSQSTECNRKLSNVASDLHNINTNCRVQAFGTGNYELERSLQNADIVLMLESGYLNVDMPFEKRFCYQAPIIKNYTDSIACECPKAFIIVCATPIDCMVPLVAETLKETGWYDPRRILGSLAVPEMRASTLAARALGLEPRYTRVPCVAGTEGDSLVPLFSKAVEYFEFAKHNALMLTDAVRAAPKAVSRADGECMRAADLSEAHALAGLVTKVAHALLCNDVPRVTGFVETDAGQVVSPARFFANRLEISGHGIVKHIGLPKMTDTELILVDIAVSNLVKKQKTVKEWFEKYNGSSSRLEACQLQFFTPKPYDRLEDCAYANIFIANRVAIGGRGIIKHIGLPKMTNTELILVDLAISNLVKKQKTVKEWIEKYGESSSRLDACQLQFFTPKPYDRFDDCTYAIIFLAIDMLLNKQGIYKKFDLPGKMSELEKDLMDTAMEHITSNDKLLNKLEENEPELASSPEEECVICVNAKATMQTSPCGHRVVCRRCFVKTIQMAVSQRLLPLRCVICRAKILRLRQAPRLVTSKSWQVSSGSGKSWCVPGSVSSYSVGARSVPASASLYSVTSGESSLSGVSSVSSNSGVTIPNGCTTKLCGGAKCGGACLGAVPRATASTPPKPRQPASNSLRRSQHQSMKARLQEYQVHSYTGGPVGEPSGRLPPIREFQREFREGRRESAATASASTRIRCAQKIVTQLETSPQKDKQHFFRPLKPSNKDDPPKSRDQSQETERKNDNPKSKSKKEEKKKKEDENTKLDEKGKKDESIDNKKNEAAERKKAEKLRLKAEKEAKKEAKLQAKVEERQAKLLAKEEEKQAKLLAKEEKKKAKKEAKLAAQAEKEINK